MSGAARTQSERRAATMTKLVAAARELFAEQGYADTTLDDICVRAAVTKGALYHHWASKRQLFATVYEQEQAGLAARTRETFLATADPWSGCEAGTRGFLRSYLDPGVQRITIVDAPGALGWQAMHELRATCYQQTLAGVTRSMEAGCIAARPAEPLAAFLYGATCEAAMAITRAADQAACLEATLEELGRIFAALRTGA